MESVKTLPLDTFNLAEEVSLGGYVKVDTPLDDFNVASFLVPKKDDFNAASFLVPKKDDFSVVPLLKDNLETCNASNVTTFPQDSFNVVPYLKTLKVPLDAFNVVEDKSSSWTSWLFKGVQEAAHHIYTNLTEGLSKLSQVDPITIVAGGILVASLAQSVWNKTETKSVDFVSKDQRIYELVLRANSKRAQLQQKSKTVKRVSTKVLQNAPKVSSDPGLQMVKKALMPTHPIMFSPL